MNSLTFVVYGLPAPQGSKKWLGNGRMVESSKAVAPWRQDVRHTAIGIKPQDWDPSLPMAITIAFRFKRPASHIGARGLKPSAPRHNTSGRNGDLSKLVRSTEDALTGILYDDDRQITAVTATKRYCIADEPQGAIITLIPLAT